MDITTNSTRVQAPDSRPTGRARHVATTTALMTPSTQSSSRDGGGSTRCPARGSKTNAPLNLRQATRIATWNVLSLAQLGYPEAMARELRRLKVSIAGLTESRIPYSGEQLVSGYTMLHSGETTRTHGVALMLDKAASDSLMSWQPISGRLLTARLKHNRGAIRIIVAYAPTEVHPVSEKDDFYDQLTALARSGTPHDQLIVLGDLNASVGTDRLGYESIIGSHGYGTANDNTFRMLSFCSSFDLAVMGSWFQRKDIHRLSWISNDGVTKKELDHMLSSDRSMFLSYRVMRGAEAPASTDHRIIVAVIKFNPQKAHSVKPTKKLDVGCLSRDPEILARYRVAVSNKFAALSDLPLDVEEAWATVRDGILQSASSAIPIARKKNRPWLTNETLALLDFRATARLAGNKTECKRLSGVFKARAKLDLEAWYSGIAAEVELGISRHETKPAYRAIQRMKKGHERKRDTTYILKCDGTPCGRDDEVLSRWKEHYEAALNFAPAAGCSDLDVAASSVEEDTSLSSDPPSRAEVRCAIGKLKNGRAAGADQVLPEFLKAAGEPVVSAIHCLFGRVWSSGHVPAEWRDGIIVSLHKGKGSRLACSSYRPITLLSVPGKVFAHVLLNRLQPLLIGHRRPQQSGFTPSRSTMDAVLTLRILAAIHKEFQQPLNVAYVDVKAAFDSVDREALWKIMRSLGIPRKLLSFVIDLHQGTTACVRTAAGVSASFQTSSGVRQGCVLAPSLFCAGIDWVMSRCEGELGIDVGSASFSDLDYADDAALFSTDPSRWTAILSRFSDEAATIGLMPSWKKTTVQNFGAGVPPPNISIMGEAVESVDSFIYLGSEVNSSGYCSSDIRRRIGIAHSVMSQLDKVWRQGRLSLATKLRIYKSCILSTLLYGSECWSLLKQDADRLQACHMQ